MDEMGEETVTSLSRTLSLDCYSFAKRFGGEHSPKQVSPHPTLEHTDRSFEVECERLFLVVLSGVQKLYSSHLAACPKSPRRTWMLEKEPPPWERNSSTIAPATHMSVS